MPDKRSHRGPHPEDAKLFTSQTLGVLCDAVADMGWLLSHGYAEKSSLKLVGDRYELRQRQRLAVMRASCSDSQLTGRNRKQILPEQASGEMVLIDGYNLLITIEAALSGAPLFVGRDGCVRDLASLHGTYRKVEETLSAVEIIAERLGALDVSNAVWLLDRPVSNSAKLKVTLLEYAQDSGLDWQVRLEMNPDKVLCESEGTIVSSDSVVLDHCRQWLNLGLLAVEAVAARVDIQLFDLRCR